MKRMKNSVKAIIITICAVIVAVSAIVGIVLLNRDNPEPPDKSYTPPHASVQALKQYVNAQNVPTTNLAEEINMADFVDQNGIALDVENMRHEDNYYKINSADKTEFYFKSTTSSDVTCYVNPMDFMNLPVYTIYKEAVSVSGNYLSIKYVTKLDGVYDMNLAIYDIENPQEPELIGNIITVSDIDSEYKNNFSEIYLSSNFYVVSKQISSIKYVVDFYTYNSDVLNKSISLENENIKGFDFTDNAYYLVTNNKGYFGYFNNDTLTHSEFLTDNCSDYFIADNFVFVENYKNLQYSYFVIDVQNGKKQNFSIEDYDRATFHKVQDGYFYVHYKNLDEFGNVEDGEIVYFDKSFNKLYSYKTLTSSESILYFSKNTFITTGGIYDAIKKLNSSIIHTFNSNDFKYELANQYIFNDLVILMQDSTGYRLYDLNDGFLFDDVFVNIQTYKNYCIAQKEDSHFIVNYTTKTKELISKFIDDENSVYAYANGGVYFQLQENSLLKFKSIDNTISIPDIAQVSTQYTLDSTILNLITTTGSKSYIIDGVYNTPSTDNGFSGAVPYDSSYGSASGTNWSASFSDGSTGNYTVTITMSTGYYASSFSVTVDKEGSGDNGWFNGNTDGLTSYGSHDGAGSRNPSFSKSTNPYKYTISGHTGAAAFGITNCSGFLACSVTAKKIYATLNLDLKGGSGTSSYTVYYDTWCSVAHPTRTGYTFSGWSGSYLKDKAAGYTFKPTTLGTVYTASANWTKNTYTVSYYANYPDNVDVSTYPSMSSWGSNFSSSKTATYDNNFTHEGTITLDHYTFLGWNETEHDAVSSSSSAPSGTISPSTTVTPWKTTSNKTYYGVWKKGALTMRFTYATYVNSTPNFRAFVAIPLTYKETKASGDVWQSFQASGSDVVTTEYTRDGSYFVNSSNEKFYMFTSSYGKVSSYKTSNVYYIMKQVDIANDTEFSVLFSSSTGTQTLSKSGSSYQTAKKDFTFDYMPNESISGYFTDVDNPPTAKKTLDWKYCLRKAKVAITGSQYQFSGAWAIEVDDDDDTDSFVPSKCDSGRTLQMYFNSLYPNNSDYSSTFYAYAIYESKEYIIRYSPEDIYGSASTSTDSSHKDKTNSDNILKVDLLNGSNIDAEYYFTEFESGAIDNAAYLNNVNINIELNKIKKDNEWQSIGEKYYIFNKVVLSQVGWKYYASSSYSYGYIDIVLTYNDNGKNDESGWTISTANAYNASGSSVSIGTKYTIKSGTDGNGDTYYYVGNYNGSDLKYNMIYINESATSEKLSITVKRCGISGDYIQSGTLTGNSSQGTWTVNETTATAGVFGFTIKAYAKSNYTENDTVTVDTSATGTGTALVLNTEKVLSGGIFWINNNKCQLPSSADAGYYAYDTTSDGIMKFVASTATINNTSGFSNNNVYYDKSKGMVYYATSYRNKFNTKSTYKLKGSNINTNFNNTQIIAIRPEQYLTYLSKDASSVGQSQYYELKSYLSSVSITPVGSNEKPYTFTLTRDVNTSASAYNAYWDMNFTDATTGRKDYRYKDGTTYKYLNGTANPTELSYMGFYYEVFDCYYFTYGARDYVLYLTYHTGSGAKDSTTKKRANATHEVMYFLYSDVYSQVTKGEDQANGVTAIKFTFTDFDNQITLTVNTENEAAGREDLFNEKDNPLVYRFGVSQSSTNEATLYKSPISLVSGYTATALAAFGESKNATDKYFTTTSAAYKYNPSDFILFELQPTDGYIIKNITVKVGGVQLFKLAYQNTGINERKADNNINSIYTFTNSTIDGGSTVTRPDIYYTGSGNKYYRLNEGVYSSSLTGFGGVMLAQTTNSNGVWQTNYAGNYFSTIALMISGVYTNVEINVETMSYAEFYFIDTNSKLGFSPTGGNKLNNLTLLVNENNTGWTKVEYGTDKDAYIVNGIANTHYRVIFEGKAKLLKNGIKIFASGDNYSANFTKGTLYADDSGKMFPHLLYSYGDDFTGRKSDGGSLYSNVLTDDNNIAHSGGLSIGSKAITYNDVATYVFIKDIRRVSTFGGSLGTSAANYVSTTYNNVKTKTYNWEYNNKYLFVMSVSANTSTFGINSYLYNESISNRTEKPFIVNITGKTTGQVQVTADDAARIQPGMVARILSNSGEEIKADLKVTNVEVVGGYATVSLKYGTSDASMTGVPNNAKLEFTTYRHSAENLGASTSEYFDDSDNKLQWIYSNGFEAYQLDYVGPYASATDKYYKSGSWFNDTILTQIDYGYTGNLLQWQKAGERNEFINTQTSNGYAIKYKYYEIPGYYLNYIEFDTVDFGRVFINVFSLFNDNDDDVEMSLFSQAGIGYYFDLSYSDGVFTLLLYNDGENKGYESLGFISNNVTVNFYSYPYTYNIRLNANTGHSTSASTTLSRSGELSQEVKYDNLIYIDTYLSMTGYTFVGWGSETYYKNATNPTVLRYGNSIWNTSSYWTSMVNYFSYDKRADLLALNQKTVYTSDFYVKSSNAANESKTAYFITDTGFSSSTYGTIENYNFWSSHAKMFIQSINNYGKNVCECGACDCTDCDCAYKGTIQLYAIWKANVYTLQFEVNDNDSKYNNGSTDAKLNVAQTNDKTGSFDDKFDDTGLLFSIATAPNVQGTTKYYCYITFDTDDWYITDSNDIRDSEFSYYDDTYKVWSDNLLDVVIDRYGYSWLGWFSKKETNVKELEKDTKLLSANRIFGSPYYTNNLQTRTTLANTAKDAQSTILKFDLALHTNFAGNGTLTDVYSEFVYKGQRKVDDTKSAVYAYFYDYSSSGVSTHNIGHLTGCQLNPDYLNVFTGSTKKDDGTWFTAFDTSLTYDCYKYDVGNLVVKRSLAENSPAIRYIKLYAYWQINYYNFVIDWQDSTGNASTSMSRTGHGSSVAGILSGTNVVKNSFDGAYFDDIALSNRLNNFMPVRVGYDFLGWSFFYNTAKSNELQVLGLHKETGKQDTALWLSDEFTTYYGTSTLPLYTVAECIMNNNPNAFTSYEETLGSDNTLHYVYMFAIWQSQTFTINVSLNIDYEELENLYEKDSAFGVALYNNLYNQDGVTISGIDFDTYKGIRTDYYKYDSTNYTEIVANLNFVINFDENFSTSYCVVKENKNATTEVVEKKFYLRNLFATSAGYYLLGWMYNPDNSTNMLVYNTLKSMFGTNGVAVTNNFADGTSKFSDDTNDQVFNFAMYNKLFNTNHEQDTAKEFTVAALKNNDGHGKSSNFGYITIGSTNYYIACDDIKDNDGNIVDHALYFKYKGLKYYIVIYNDTSADVLKNDHSFLYYTEGGIDYKVRFDSNKKAYIVKSMYESRKVLNLKIAAFRTYNANNKDAINTSSNLFGYIEESSSYKFTYDPDAGSFVNAKVQMITTRQFTLYAHWANKNDFKININNGNNAKVDDAYTYYSNEGLAGYFKILTTLNHGASYGYTHNLVTPTNPSTSNSSGQLESGISATFNYYDDMDINILPYYNGRYLSEMTLKFYGIEESILNTNEDSGQMSSKFMYTTYTLKFKFDWDSKNRKIILREGTGVIYNVNNGDDYQYKFVVSDFDQGQQLTDITFIDKKLEKLSIIDAESFSDYIFRMFKYADKTNNDEYNNLYHDDRVDMNKVSLSMDRVMSNIDITCEFSVQTYDVKFYSLLDPVANNMKHLENTVKSYESTFSQADFETNIDNNNEAGENGTYFSQTAFGEAKLATIPQDCAESTKLQDVSKFNVPYGYFIYGQYYTSAFAPNRPIDEASAGNNVVAMLNTEKYGYEYIYSNGYYNYGSTIVQMKSNGSDSFYSQCSPVLGPTYLFSQAVGFRKDGLSFYTFGGWYEYEKVQNNVVVFTSYDRTSEATYINNDMTLYGYYYPINTPTSIEFYTWDDDGSRYQKYNENSNQYTLNANIESFPFDVIGNVLVKSQQQLEYFDNDGIAKIKQYTKYGVNSTGFVNDEYLNPLDFDPQIAIDKMMLEMVLETYWFFENSYLTLYFMNGTDRIYIKYDNQFYYEIGGVRTNVEIETFDNQNYKIKATGMNLLQETKYKYGSIFDGSNLYVTEVGASIETNKYYKVHKVTSEMLTAATNGTYKGINAAATAVNNGEANLIKKYQPRFYYDMHGQRYFLLARNENNSVQNSNAVYWYSSTGGDTDGVVIGSTNNVVTIKNYYVEYGSEYYTINYKVHKDDKNSEYINPYADYKTNQVVVSTGTGDVLCYFDYNTKYLYEFISSTSTYQRVSFTHYIYCPINENYFVNTTTDNGKWSTGEITIKSLPSPNIGFWYNGDKYGFVGYIKLTDEIITDMKRAPSNTGTDLGGIIYQKFTSYVNVIYSKENFAQAKFASTALYNTFLTEYGGAGNTSLDVAYAAFIEALYANVGNMISSFNKDQLLSSLLLAEKYKYKELASGQIIISGVEVNIPIKFKDVMIDPRTGNNLSISITIKTDEAFEMISTDTGIDTNVYAVPIYSPYVMKFNEESVKSKTTANLTVDINKMDVWHFELGSDASYNYNKQNGDYLNFVLLTHEQFESISDTNGDLSAIIKAMSETERNNFMFKETTALGDTNDVVIDMSNCIIGNTYVLVAYYNQTGITDVSKTYVVRASDNAIKLTRGNSSITHEFIEMNTD